ncbi:MAG: tRNA (N6-isopentenyl adenosine(37)-C2)-methylthiotransferase MiaB [bacterium]
MKLKYHIWTIGCQMNKSDSERIAAFLEKNGYNPCMNEDDADLIVVVACSVRQSAVDRIYGRSARYEKYKKKNPNLKTVLTGCVLDVDKKKLIKKFDLICDIREIEKIPNITNEKIGNILNYSYFSIAPKHCSQFRAYIPVMTGCNNFCAYCVVPFTRDREYSRPVLEIFEEVNDLVKKGYKEITLIGQNVNSYSGKTFPLCRPLCQVDIEQDKFLNFPELLRLINSIKGDFWIRFATSHPKDMSEKLIDAIAECEKITPYIHLPLQAGSDKILKMMNRQYTRARYLDLIKKIKNCVPNAMISTDIIVGFPGETKKDFLETVDIFKKIKYSMAYIAKYSPRAGTAAYNLNDNISPDEKARRERILNKILKETALENNKKFIGKTVRVLIEQQAGNNYIGKTAQFINTKIIETKNEKTQDIKIGQFIDIKITQATSFGMEGVI